MAGVCENAEEEREEGERGEESEEGGVEGARGTPQTDPIIEEYEHCCVIHKKHQQQHSQNGH